MNSSTMNVVIPEHVLEDSSCRFYDQTTSTNGRHKEANQGARLLPILSLLQGLAYCRISERHHIEATD